ncbi:hypothetical protein Pint_25161 [Pistacia integerrima]|uniref:Uncharacterized protein n=1 Tax=Pistacia integerrima TaxID=434235 RepID=A0ACC0YAP2_9ROSI|nr:hypothetical protein Pint_25161 [Pistacia integerrima]
MQGGLGLVGVGGGGGGKGGGSANESTVSKVEKDYDHHPAESDELELGLGLSLGGGKSKGSAWGECGRILTAKDFPSAVSGTKRAADSVSHEGGSPPSISQVVGWPPIRAYRMNSLVNQAKAPRSEEEKVGSDKEKSKDNLKKKICNGNKTNSMFNEKGHLGFVKVNIDGLPIGRKVDLNAHACYETLAQTLEEMFFSSTPTINSIGLGAEKKDSAAKTSKLLDGSSEFVLTYEDKEGDWMLVGDVPWGMFLCSVKRLRIMRTSEANGLGPIFQERNEKQKAKPV